MFDALTLFSNDQDISAMNANDLLLCDKSVDLGVAGTDALGNTVLKDVGRGMCPELLIQVTTAVTGAGGALVTFQLVEADNEALDSNLVILASTAAIAVTALVAGYQARLCCVPPGVSKRFIGVRFLNTIADLTAGKITAGLVIGKNTGLAFV